MTNCVTFQNELTTIMNVLVKAAVTDISKLFDDRSSFLRLEISYHQRENTSLKRKLQWLESELKAARYGKEMKAPQISVNNHRSDNDQDIELEENWSECLFIKEERLKDDSESSDTQRRLRIICNGPVECEALGSNERGVRNVQRDCDGEQKKRPTHALNARPLTEQHLGRLGTKKMSRLRTGYKLEEEYECAIQRPGHMTPGQDTPRRLRPQFTTCETDSSLELTQERSEPGSGDPADKELQAQLALLGAHHGQASEASSSLFPLSLPDMKLEVSDAKLTDVKDEIEMLSVCNDEARIEVVQLHPMLHSTDMERQQMQPEGNLNTIKNLLEGQQRRFVEKNYPQSESHSIKQLALGRSHDHSTCEGSFPLLKSSNAAQRPDAGDRRFNCVNCGKGFTQRGHLKIHQLIHTGEKPYACSHCAKSFTHIHVLKRHLSVHTGHRPYTCSHCGKSFSLQDSLRRHRRIHTGEKPYACVYCGKRFTQGSHLKIHQLIHTGEKPFSCSQCDKSFTQLHVLKRHLNVHSGQKPYVCAQCGKKFTLQDSLKRHLRIHGEAELLIPQGLRVSGELLLRDQRSDM